MDKTVKMLRKLIPDRQYQFPFGATDKAGRAMGVTIERAEAEFYRAPELAMAYMVGTEDELGYRYGFRPHATRDGKGFGPTQEWRWFKRKDERAAAIIRYMEEAQRRAVAGTKKRKKA